MSMRLAKTSPHCNVIFQRRNRDPRINFECLDGTHLDGQYRFSLSRLGFLSGGIKRGSFYNRKDRKCWFVVQITVTSCTGRRSRWWKFFFASHCLKL